MLLYRVFPYLATAKPGESGTPQYLHRPQGRMRLDNPGYYDIWYFGTTPEAAIGETFGDLARWRNAMFVFPALPGSRRVLGIFEVTDDIGVLDMDDANTPVRRGLRPTQVVSRNRPVTQEWALDVYKEKRWAGIKWWSFHRPHWTVIALWTDPMGDPPATFVRHEEMDRRHSAVADVATSLARPWL